MPRPKKPEPRSPRRELLALIGACKDEPEGDAPRHVLADWLEEHGDETDRERAALIRLELMCGDGRPDFARLRRHLWERLRPRCAPFPRGLWRPANGCERGLLHAEISPSAPTRPDCLRWAGSEAWAWVEEVTAAPTRAGLADALTSPLLDGVSSLCLAQARFDGPARAALARRLATLRKLRLVHGRFDGGLAALGRSAHAGRLRSLAFFDVRLTGEDLAALADPDALPGLEELDLPHVGDDAALRDILRAGRPLRSLALSDLTDGEPLRLAADRLTGLRRLHLQVAPTSWDGLTFAPGLEDLALLDRMLPPAAAAALAAARLGRLRSLWVAPQSADDLAELAASRLLGGLTSLTMWVPRLGPGVAALAAAPSCPATLNLTASRVGDAGLTALAAWPGLASCRVLKLGHNGISASGVAALADSPHAAGLTALSLKNNPLGREGVETLLRAPWLGNLQALSIDRTRAGGELDRAVVEAAAGRTPHLRELLVDDVLAAALRPAFAHVPFVG